MFTPHWLPPALQPPCKGMSQSTSIDMAVVSQRITKTDTEILRGIRLRDTLILLRLILEVGIVDRKKICSVCSYFFDFHLAPFDAWGLQIVG